MFLTSFIPTEIPVAEINSASISPLISSDALNEATRAALMLFIGRGRRFSVAQVAKASGVDGWRIDAAKLPLDNENFRALPDNMRLSIAAVIGPDFTNEWLPLAAQGAFTLPDDEPEPGDFAADNTDDNAKVVRAAVDGRFDANERKDLSVVGSAMVARGAQLVALGKRRAA